MTRLNLLFIDNKDSFTFNLVEEFAVRDCAVEVWRHDVDPTSAYDHLTSLPSPRLLVLSPGPGGPSQAGCSLELVRRAAGEVPIFGICLGHQVIVEALGGEVGRAPRAVHGKGSVIRHDGEGIYAGLPAELKVGRYHSLCAVRVPEELEVSATCGEVVMGVRDAARGIDGVQFHPESILTRDGGRLIENVIEGARAHRAQGGGR